MHAPAFLCRPPPPMWSIHAVEPALAHQNAVAGAGRRASGMSQNPLRTQLT